MPIAVGRAMSGSLTDHAIHLRLPLKPEYLPVLRATAGVINYNYDEIMQIRVAVSEVFDQALRFVSQDKPDQEILELRVKFMVEEQHMELVITTPVDSGDRASRWLDEEGQAVIGSLMDKVELGPDNGTVRMIKYRSVAQSR